MTLSDNGAHSPLPFDASKVHCKSALIRIIPPGISRLLKKVTSTHVDKMRFHYNLSITIS